MRNKVIIGAAAFYLLLSSGMFACVIGCGSQSLVKLFTFESSNHHHQKKDKDCTGKEDCSCCEKHGNYRVKENIKPNLNWSILQLPLVAFLGTHDDFPLASPPVVILHAEEFSHPPAFNSSVPIFIGIRSLRI